MGFSVSKIGLGIAAALVAGGCAQPVAEKMGTHVERFVEALAPSARECVLSAIPKGRLESALADLAKLPSRGEDLPPYIAQLEACTGQDELRKGIARVVLEALPKQRSRLMLAQEDTPEAIREVKQRLAAFPRRLAERFRFTGFERRGPARLSVAYQRADVPDPPQSLSVDVLAEPGLHPYGWTAGEIVAATARRAGERLVAAGIHHGVVWARFVEPAYGTTRQVVVWGDIDGGFVFRAEGESREVLRDLVTTFRAGA